MAEQHQSAADVRHEFIVFRVGAQEFCLDIMSVREIRGWTQATVLPHAPGYVRGVINLRGSVLPVVDLSDRLGFAPIEGNARQVIIVVQIGGKLVGMLVDAVSDILSQSSQVIQPTPEVASGQVLSFLQGVLAIDGRMIGLIRVDEIMPDQRELAA
jgi:purine-binding chemotaxis protein CheW